MWWPRREWGKQFVLVWPLACLNSKWIYYANLCVCAHFLILSVSQLVYTFYTLVLRFSLNKFVALCRDFYPCGSFRSLLICYKQIQKKLCLIQHIEAFEPWNSMILLAFCNYRERIAETRGRTKPRAKKKCIKRNASAHLRFSK